MVPHLAAGNKYACWLDNQSHVNRCKMSIEREGKDKISGVKLPFANWCKNALILINIWPTFLCWYPDWLIFVDILNYNYGPSIPIACCVLRCNASKVCTDPQSSALASWPTYLCWCPHNLVLLDLKATTWTATKTPHHCITLLFPHHMHCHCAPPCSCLNGGLTRTCICSFSGGLLLPFIYTHVCKFPEVKNWTWHGLDVAFRSTLPCAPLFQFGTIAIVTSMLDIRASCTCDLKPRASEAANSVLCFWWRIKAFQGLTCGILWCIVLIFVLFCRLISWQKNK